MNDLDHPVKPPKKTHMLRAGTDDVSMCGHLGTISDDPEQVNCRSCHDRLVADRRGRWTRRMTVLRDLSKQIEPETYDETLGGIRVGSVSGEEAYVLLLWLTQQVKKP